MAGVKGRSGIADTLEARAARAAAGRAGAEARRAKSSAPNEGHDPTAPAPKTLGDYDRLIGLPKSWADGIKREQMVGEMIANEQREMDLQVKRGALLTLEDVQARDERWNGAMIAQAEGVFRLLDGVEGVSPAIRTAFLAAAKAWRQNLGDTLSKIGRQ